MTILFFYILFIIFYIFIIYKAYEFNMVNEHPRDVSSCDVTDR